MFFATTDSSATPIVKEFDQDLTFKQSWTAYEPDYNLTYLRYLKGTSLLLTIAELLGVGPVIKLWNLEKRDKKTNEPHCHAIVKVTNGDNTFPISAFDITSNYSTIALGFADGSVVLVRGDIVHDRGSRQRVIYDSGGPVTGLAFHEPASDNQLQQDVSPLLFVSTVNRIFTLSTTGKNNGKPEKVLDKHRGADLGCSCYDKATGMFVVARPDSVLYYTSKGRGPSFVFDISKKRIFPYKQYIVIVSSSSGGSADNTQLSSLLGSIDDVYTTSRLLIVDSANQYIAYTGQISQGVKDIFVQWDKLQILGTDGVLYQFEEKTLQDRLNILTQRNLYDVAIKLGESLNIEKNIILTIEQEYGDHLYKNGEVGDALPHYISCIDLGGTSQIILKYRESQYIKYLTLYLEALHEHGYADKEHTTLLLNAYSKLKDNKKLQEFIENDANSKRFDFETAIQICRQGGYYDLASSLAKKMGESQLVVQIKLKDLKDYKGTLTYVRSLPVDECLRILVQNSRILLNMFPNDTTQLLINLFTGKYIPKSEEQQEADEKRKTKAFKKESSEESTSESNINIAAPVLQSYRAFVNYMSSISLESSEPTETDSQVEESQKPTYQPPRPRLIFSSFVDHPSEFVIFLEACLEAYEEFSGNEKDRKDLLSTLYEMYLELSQQADTPESTKEWEEKAKNLAIESKDSLDSNTILLLSHLSNFNEGQILTQNQEGFQINLFRACVASGDVQGAINVLRKYGDEEPELYPLALTFFTSSDLILKEAKDEFQYVLDKIRDEQLMAPLQVVQALSVNSVATVGMVKDYLVNIILKEKLEIDNNLKLSDSYQTETKSKLTEIKKLTSDPMVIQYSTCAACNTSLDLPAVHFACKHSFHQRCLNSPDESHPACPVCLPNVESITAMRKSQDDTSDRYDLFKLALEGSDSKFKVVTDFFGRGAMEQARYIIR